MTKMRAVCLVLCSVVLGQWQAFGASQKQVAAGVWRGEGIELTEKAMLRKAISALKAAQKAPSEVLQRMFYEDAEWYLRLAKCYK